MFCLFSCTQIPYVYVRISVCRDGKITTQELLDALLKNEGLSREKAVALCGILDVDKDGSLDLDELKRVRKPGYS